MNREKIEEAGLAPLTSVLQAMGGWPVLEGDSWDQEGFKWFDMVYKFRDEGFSVDYLVDFSVTTDLRNSSWRTLDLDQPRLRLKRKYMMKGEMDMDASARPLKLNMYTQAYLTYMTDVAVLLGAEKNEAEKQMREVLEFEIKLLNITMSR